VVAVRSHKAPVAVPRVVAVHKVAAHKVVAPKAAVKLVAAARAVEPRAAARPVACPMPEAARLAGVRVVIRLRAVPAAALRVEDLLAAAARAAVV
jgi:hypothetical protein